MAKTTLMNNIKFFQAVIGGELQDELMIDQGCIDKLHSLVIQDDKYDDAADLLIKEAELSHNYQKTAREFLVETRNIIENAGDLENNNPENVTELTELLNEKNVNHQSVMDLLPKKIKIEDFQDAEKQLRNAIAYSNYSML